MQLYSIASGSSGNSILIGSEHKTKKILVDVGISKKRIEEGMAHENMSFEDVEAIFITHEHTDHICGLGPVLRKYKVPVYATRGTVDFIFQSGKCGKLEQDLFHCVSPDVPVSVGGMEVVPFSISHDAAEPVCYTVSDGIDKVAVATDMGEYTDYTLSHLQDCKGLLLEANHDINMLQAGSYPYSLKLRILGNKGHLSNDACGRLLRHLVHYNLKHILLGHLSRENNYPELAYETVRYELQQEDDFFSANDLFLGVAGRQEPTPLIHT
jgi:phosphoribosyl 1,2-cyclic phosphodiesterase